MQVVWDPRKAKVNKRKHGVRFSDAEGVLYDPHAITREDRGAQGERRYVSVGRDHVGGSSSLFTATEATAFA